MSVIREFYICALLSYINTYIYVTYICIYIYIYIYIKHMYINVVLVVINTKLRKIIRLCTVLDTESVVKLAHNLYGSPT